jgi:hypothetical protein
MATGGTGDVEPVGGAPLEGNEGNDGNRAPKPVAGGAGTGEGGPGSGMGT